MQLVKQSFEILEQEIPVRKLDDYSGEHFREQYIENMYKHIEKCGRTCYKSEDRITEGSAKRFVEGLIKTKHYSVLEHGVIYLHCRSYGTTLCKYQQNEYSKYQCLELKNYKPREKGWDEYVSTNYRVIVENGWEDDLQYLCEPTEFHEKRYTVLLHSCIHVYKDLTRHRKMNFSIESTRYCNYSKTDKFGEMKFVILPWIKYLNNEGKWYGETRNGSSDYTIGKTTYNIRNLIKLHKEDCNNIISSVMLYDELANVEMRYKNLINKGWQPQQAAEILPQATAADVVMSGFASDWEFIFLLRSKIARTGAPHPLVEELMTPLMEEFKQKGYISKEFPN